MAKTVEITATATTAAATEPIAPASQGLRLHQSQTRSPVPTRRAAMGRLSSQARRSSASACAVG